MLHYIKILFFIISILFGLTGLFFLFTVLLASYRPDILTYTTSGSMISVFVAIVCFCFAYTLWQLSRGPTA